jgi:hypothetical protein
MEKVIAANGFTLTEMPGDGNCFFKALVHLTKKSSMTALRRAVAERLREKKADYMPFFTFGKNHEAEYMKATKAVERSRCWNNQIMDIVIMAMADVIGANFTIYNVDDEGHVEKYEVATAGSSRHLHLLRTGDNHFDALEQ